MSILKFLVFLEKSQVVKVIEKENFCVQRDASGMSFLHPLGNLGVRGNKLQVKFEFFFSEAYFHRCGFVLFWQSFWPKLFCYVNDRFS